MFFYTFYYVFDIIESESLTSSSNDAQRCREWRRHAHLQQPRSILQRALDACDMSWDVAHLPDILRHDSSSTQFDDVIICDEDKIYVTTPTDACTCNNIDDSFDMTSPSTSTSVLRQTILKDDRKHRSERGSTSCTCNRWREHVTWACARVDALRAHGCATEAQRLAVVVARNLKRANKPVTSHWYRTMTSSRRPACEGWIGHPLDPIGCIFDVLLERSKVEVTSEEDSAPIESPIT